jgi:hypothetical protein
MGSQGIVFMVLVSIGLIQLQMDHSGGYFLTAWSFKTKIMTSYIMCTPSAKRGDCSGVQQMYNKTKIVGDMVWLSARHFRAIYPADVCL